MLGVVSGNTPESRGRVLDLLRLASPDALVLSVSVHGDQVGRYPFVQRLVTGGDERQRASLSQVATGDPAVIVRQDLGAIARAAASPHVVLALPDNVDAVSFLAELWRTPLGRTPLSDHYDLAPLAAGIDLGRLLSDLRCVHRSAHVFGDRPQAVPLTVAEAAARLVEAAHMMVVRDGRGEDGSRIEGSRALLAHLNPSAEILLDAEDCDSAPLTTLTRPDSTWAAGGPADRLDPVASVVRRRGIDHGVASVLWRSRRPLHPERLAESLPQVMPAVVRSRGHLWVATHPDAVISWRSAGRHLELREAGRWLEGGDTEGWRAASPQRRTLASWYWDDYYGERRNEILLTGADLDEDRLRAALDAAVLDDRELALGADHWACLPDPLLGAAAQDPEG
ncbi:cobalamin biosynthesis protein CobW [Streptomyces botrytidirepellens]|uniref:Cobalamin biosynthesis protein CobW n=1 Tax=Streptomyces botrytidirepellens TaxID=2486417 RepID=A0A3M8WZE0_9ACTN|nr:cobalamin biosynthesis protein CobW [Streptomyces botrytidirepellens]